MNKSLFVLLMMVFAGKAVASSFTTGNSQVIITEPTASDTLFLKSGDAREVLLVIPKTNQEKRKRLISAMLAFPFPFGFMGAHRVMLGCKPWVPVVYVATFGGCFGLLPMIDFIAIICSKDIEQYENNPHVFMWLK